MISLSGAFEIAHNGKIYTTMGASAQHLLKCFVMIITILAYIVGFDHAYNNRMNKNLPNEKTSSGKITMM